MKEEAHFSRDEERKKGNGSSWGPAGSEAVGPSLLSELPHREEGGSALWGMRSQAPGSLQSWLWEIESVIIRDSVRPSTSSKKQGQQGKTQGPGPGATWTNRCRGLVVSNLHKSHSNDCIIHESHYAPVDLLEVCGV